MKTRNAFILFVSILMFITFSCKQDDNIVFAKITVNNNLSIDRKSETIKIIKSELNETLQSSFDLLKVVDLDSNKIESQFIDINNDDLADVLIFQPVVSANSSKVYNLIKEDKQDSVVIRAYSRFVPERTDDYAWENDRIAFRTFGPVAQKMKEAGDPNGTLSSGIDCWLKRVEYPIINKWYSGSVETIGFYHTDRGEGYDPYHVGTSRGCGGLGVYENNEMLVSKNYTEYKTMSNGSVRTCFKLNYADWKAGDKTVKEQKHISLDVGSNLMRIVAKIEGVEVITVGITLHENKGQTTIDTVNRCFSYWEPIHDSELGTGIVVAPEYYLGYTEVVTEEHDKSQLFIHLKVIDGKVEYRNGFGWKKSGQFASSDEWNEYLVQVSKQIITPLEVNIE